MAREGAERREDELSLCSQPFSEPFSSQPLSEPSAMFSRSEAGSSASSMSGVATREHSEPFLEWMLRHLAAFPYPSLLLAVTVAVSVGLACAALMPSSAATSDRELLDF